MLCETHPPYSPHKIKLNYTNFPEAWELSKIIRADPRFLPCQVMLRSLTLALSLLLDTTVSME